MADMDISEVKQDLRGPMIPVITNLNEDLSIAGVVHEGQLVPAGALRKDLSSQL